MKNALSKIMVACSVMVIMVTVLLCIQQYAAAGFLATVLLLGFMFAPFIAKEFEK